MQRWKRYLLQARLMNKHTRLDLVSKHAISNFYTNSISEWPISVNNHCVIGKKGKIFDESSRNSWRIRNNPSKALNKHRSLTLIITIENWGRFRWTRECFWKVLYNNAGTLSSVATFVRAGRSLRTELNRLKPSIVWRTQLATSISIIESIDVEK